MRIYMCDKFKDANMYFGSIGAWMKIRNKFMY
jgi:hypothetical protein